MIVTVVARSVPFDNYDNGFISTDVQAALEELSFTHFNYRIVETGRRVTIRYEQQMYVYHEFKVESGGEIVVRGELVIRP